jgi:hypothetical protein
MEITVGPPRWMPKVIASADLVRAYRAARELQRLSVPPHLGKQLAAPSCGRGRNSPPARSIR